MGSYFVSILRTLGPLKVLSEEAQADSCGELLSGALVRKDDGTEVAVGSWEETTKKSRWEAMGQEETVELERE